MSLGPATCQSRSSPCRRRAACVLFDPTSCHRPRLTLPRSLMRREGNTENLHAMGPLAWCMWVASRVYRTFSSSKRYRRFIPWTSDRSTIPSGRTATIRRVRVHEFHEAISSTPNLKAETPRRRRVRAHGDSQEVTALPSLQSALRPAAACLASFVLLCGALMLTAAKPTSAGATTSEAVSVAYQMDATHDGDQPNETLPTSPVEKWSDDFGGSVSYPLIVGDRVFVTVSGNGQGGYGSELYALDASNGDSLWGPIELGGTYFRAGIAYDNGLVFAVNSDGQLTAFAAATGYEDWQTSLPGQYSFTSAPTASGGVVYVGGAGGGGTLYAVNESNGELLWTGSVENGDQSSPVVTSTGVYVSYACEQTYDFAPSTGDLIWHHSTDCEGGGGRTPVLYNGNLYVRDDAGMAPAILSAATGADLGGYSSTTAPAFDNSLEFTMNNGTLSALQASTGAGMWSQTADGSLDSAPIVVGGKVYVAGSSGLVASFSESTGVETWSANAGSPITAPDEHNVSDELTGLAAGDDLLVVPASDTLVAFGSNDPSDPSSPGPPPAPSGSISGTVTDSSGAGLAGACALLVNPTTGEFSGPEGVTDASGDYSLSDVPPGSYDVYFLYGCQAGGLTGNFAPDIYNNATDLSSAQTVTIGSGQTTNGINAELQTGGQITGVVTDASGDPTGNVAVAVVRVGDVPTVAITTLTGADGTYDIPDLSNGSYLVEFEYCISTSSCQSAFYNGTSTLTSATLVSVTIATTTSGINATTPFAGTAGSGGSGSGGSGSGGSGSGGSGSGGSGSGGSGSGGSGSGGSGSGGSGSGGSGAPEGGARAKAPAAPEGARPQLQ